jgi:hypothetical protein
MTATLSRPDTAYFRSIERTREQFKANTDEHQMTVLHDTVFEGGAPYRHVRFSRRGTGIWSFDLVTWPGHLTISGDLQPFTFRRTHDMFAFFNGGVDINPSYWGEKVVAGTTEGFCTEQWTETVRRMTNDYLTDVYDRPKFDAEDDAAIRAAVQEELLDADPTTVDYARHLLHNFSVYLPATGDSFQFEETYEWPIEGYLHHFLLSCHAIRWGVETYLREFPGRLLDKKD